MSEGEPSAATWRVSLKLRAGERDEQMVFENVAVHDPSCSLGKFLDTVLEDLEVRATELRKQSEYNGRVGSDTLSSN